MQRLDFWNLCLILDATGGVSIDPSAGLLDFFLSGSMCVNPPCSHVLIFSLEIMYSLVL